MFEQELFLYLDTNILHHFWSAITIFSSYHILQLTGLKSYSFFKISKIILLCSSLLLFDHRDYKNFQFWNNRIRKEILFQMCLQQEVHETNQEIKKKDTGNPYPEWFSQEMSASQYWHEPKKKKRFSQMEPTSESSGGSGCSTSRLSLGRSSSLPRIQFRQSAYTPSRRPLSRSAKGLPRSSKTIPKNWFYISYIPEKTLILLKSLLTDPN